MGHIISAARVSADPTKIRSMEAWPTPTNIIALHGFLGLTGYNQKFIRNYGSIATPLTKLLKKDAFHWNAEANEAFQNLKKVMTQAPVLSLLKFSKQFMIEVDTFGKGLGTVLMQERQPMAFYNKAISGRSLARSTYEKEERSYGNCLLCPSLAELSIGLKVLNSYGSQKFKISFGAMNYNTRPTEVDREAYVV